jgi:alpha-tubulin suppressor-like RCC1 family protein
VKCTGHNTYAQLGNGEHTNRSTAVAASNLPFGVARLAVGGHDTCVVTLTGGAKCWGYNFYGHLGDGTKIDRDAPVDVVGMTAGVVELVAGDRHSCARTASGVNCWGWNEDGQLGNGSTMEALTPVAVTGL